MPEYLFQNPFTYEIVSVVQNMNDVHEYEQDGIKFVRIFTIPNSSKDTRCDPFNSKDFVNKTRDKKGTLGELWDLSKELSEKREQVLGKDPVREKYIAEWSKKRGGRQFIDTSNQLHLGE